MKLQSDVTLAYGFKVNGKKITRNMLRSTNPYNTYKFHGLPPTPISYPGENALKFCLYLFRKEGDDLRLWEKVFLLNFHLKLINYETYGKY